MRQVHTGSQTLANVLVIISMELKLEICNKTVCKYSVFKCTFKNPEKLLYKKRLMKVLTPV